MGQVGSFLFFRSPSSFGRRVSFDIFDHTCIGKERGSYVFIKHGVHFLKLIFVILSHWHRCIYTSFSRPQSPSLGSMSVCFE